MTTRPAGDFVVYGCEACGKRIFTSRSHTGLRGTCPVCGSEHTVGGTPTVYAQEGIERRDSRRVPAEHARVSVEPAALDQEALLSVRDVSETGIAFTMPGVRDPAQPSGFRPPELEPGQTLQLTLHTRELLRPRSYPAEVRRVLPLPEGGYVVGLQFGDLRPEQEAEVRALVRRISQDQG